MKYDFTSIIDRKGKDALAVDNLPNGFGIVDEVHVRDGLEFCNCSNCNRSTH